jgi:S1-C subfamily serine protease
MSRFLCALAFVAFSIVFAVPAEQPRAAAAAASAPPSANEPKFIDDDEFYDDFFEKLEAIAKDDQPLAHKKLTAKLKSRPANITPTKPGAKVLTPEEVYKTAVDSIFVVGSVYPKKEGKWEVGTYASAWVLAADGVLVSNWHVFEDLNDGEVFGACDRHGNIYPVIDFLGGDKTADVAVFRIDAKELTPLPVATTYADIGSWVGVISHPGDLFYLYTQGTVTRYSTNKNEDAKREKWMGITAEYASGSSGAPVLNKYGAVVGMSALTLSLDASDDEKKMNRRVPSKRLRADPPKDGPKGDKPKDPAKPGQPNPKGSPQQMVVKMAVPGPVLLKWVGK